MAIVNAKRRHVLSACVTGLAALLALVFAQGRPGSPAAQRSNAEQQLSSGPGLSRTTFNFARSIAADDFGRVHAVWHTTKAGRSHVHYRRSTDDGETWHAGARLSAEDGTNEHPSIAASGDDIFVVWHSVDAERKHRVSLRQSSDGGKSWKDANVISDSGTAAHASVAIAGSVVHVIWKGSPSGETQVYYRRSRDGARTWEPERQLTNSPRTAYVPSLAAFDWLVVVAWVDTRDGNEEEYIKVSIDGGGTWGPDTRMTDDRMNSWAPSVAVDGRTIHLVWFDQKHTSFHPYDAEAKLDEALRLVGLEPEAPPAGVHVPDPRRSAGPRVFYGDALRYRVEGKHRQLQSAAPRWVRQGGEPRRLEELLREFERRMKIATLEWDIYYRRSDDAGKTWGDEQRLVAVPGNSHRPHLAVSAGELHLVWWDDRDGNDEIYYKHSPDGGRNWGDDIRLTRGAAASQFPMIAATKRSRHVVWTEQRAGTSEVHYTRR